MEALHEFLSWAWARHHNPLSWYIRPLFVLPFCYFAYKKSTWGVGLTIAAVLSSMFWFPAPEATDPRAAAFLAMERQYITSPWTISKVGMTALVPVWFAALALAFWARFWLVGFVVVNGGAILKVGWSFYFAGSSAWSIIPPVALGALVINGVLMFAYRRDRRRTRSPELIAREMKTHWWNHNLHYHPLILAAAPIDCERALDVGCGDGLLTRKLRSVSKRVVGIDLDSPAIESARAQGGEGVEYILGDFFDHSFEPASFDLVASVAALHHMEAEAGLTRMACLVRPGGALVVIGLARSRQLRDFALDAVGLVATRVHRHILRKHYWEHSAPKVWPPPLSYAELRRTAVRLLPDVQYQRHVLWRYSLVWIRPRGERPSDARRSTRHCS